MTTYLSSETHQQVTLALKGYLADATLVYFKTHTFHWNVEGHHFYSLHLMFEKFYETIWESLDEIAERIRALGEKTPPNLEALLKMASLKESTANLDGLMMVTILHEDYLALAKKAHEVGAIAEGFGDQVTTDIMTEKSAFLEKAAWMLQASMTK
ncbi:MAG: DNA starvation/stationary phase protection protein [Alphaproteobacteria bacterium]|nr:DNA starvation/stationary phase protection protein [Alphaproteobacteria bacterium]